MTTGLEQKKFIRSRLATYEEPVLKKPTHIIELPDPCIRLISQLTHLYLINNPDSRLALDLYVEISRQTDIINDSPGHHYVYLTEEEAPPQSKTLSKGYYKDYDP